MQCLNLYIKQTLHQTKLLCNYYRKTEIAMFVQSHIRVIVFSIRTCPSKCLEYAPIQLQNALYTCLTQLIEQLHLYNQ